MERSVNFFIISSCCKENKDTESGKRFRIEFGNILCFIKSGSAAPNKAKVATLSKAKLQEIAELKMPDLNAASLEAAMSMIAGTARSMGVTVEE